MFWFAEWMSQGPLQEDCTRRPDCLRKLTGKGDANRRDAGSLKTACDQPHGPIAKPSGRREECKIDAVVAQLRRHLWRIPMGEQWNLSALDVTHEAKVLRRQRTNHAAPGKFAEMV